MRDYVLMNKNTPLVEIQFDRGHIVNIGEVLCRKLMPLYFSDNDLPVDIQLIREWWKGRQIPSSRDGIKDFIWKITQNTDINPVPEMTERMLGFSLSDHYWIKPVGTGATWDKLNFFTNEFSTDIGKLLIGKNIKGNLNVISPDNTSDGVIKKRWKIINGKRCLIKGYSSVDREAEPVREVLASRFLEILLPFDHVTYTTIYDTDDKELYSCCENFVTTDTEYISFNQIKIGIPRHKSMSLFDFIRSFYGSKYYVFDLMVILDFIVFNTDRHLGNFGLIRNINTGELVGPAPVFDTGSSLYHKSREVKFFSGYSKPFTPNWEEQIELINYKEYRSVIQELKDKHKEIFEEVFRDSIEPQASKEKYINSITARLDYMLSGRK